MDIKTIQTLLDLLNPLHGRLDQQTYDEKVKEGFDGPPDTEYDVSVTAQMERDLSQAVCILENRLRGVLTNEQADDIVSVMRKWADTINLPSGNFVNDDCRRAADEIETLRAMIDNNMP